MSRTEDGHRNLTVPERFKHRIQAGRIVSHMEHQHPRFSAEHSCHPDLAGQLDQFPGGHMGRPVIRDGKLQPQHFPDEYHIPVRFPGDGRSRVPVGAGEHVGRYALFLKRRCLGVKVLHTSCHAVCPQKSQNGSHAAPDQF